MNTPTPFKKRIFTPGQVFDSFRVTKNTDPFRNPVPGLKLSEGEYDTTGRYPVAEIKVGEVTRTIYHDELLMKDGSTWIPTYCTSLGIRGVYVTGVFDVALRGLEGLFCNSVPVTDQQLTLMRLESHGYQEHYLVYEALAETGHCSFVIMTSEELAKLIAEEPDAIYSGYYKSVENIPTQIREALVFALRGTPIKPHGQAFAISDENTTVKN